MIKKETVMRPGLCFFDALHYCASFQKNEEALGKMAIPVSGDLWGHAVPWQEAAKASGQMLDADGMVLPCAYGRALVDSIFEETQMVVAEQTLAESFNEKSGRVVSLADQLVTDILAKPQSYASNDSQVLLVKAQERQDKIRLYDDVMSVGQNLMEIVRIIFNHQFKLEMDVKSALGTLGIKPLYAYIKGTAPWAPERQFSLALQKFDHASARLPGAHDKELCAEFSKSTHFAFWMYRAVIEYSDMTQIHKAPESGLPFIDRAARIMSLTPEDTARMKADYLNGKLQDRNFDSIPNQIWARYGGQDGLYKHLCQRITLMKT